MLSQGDKKKKNLSKAAIDKALAVISKATKKERTSRRKNANSIL